MSGTSGVEGRMPESRNLKAFGTQLPATDVSCSARPPPQAIPEPPPPPNLASICPRFVFFEPGPLHQRLPVLVFPTV
eukprot:1334644-Rhodomonas_salina.1